MFYNAENHTMKIENTVMDYASFGTGDRPLVMIPGLTLKGVKGSAFPLAQMYRIFVKDFKVYIFDRKEDIPEGYTVRDIAKDVAFAMHALGISDADVFGVSQGGMVAQYLAIDYPELVHKLVLGVTLSRGNDTVNAAVGNWIEMSNQNRFEDLVVDIMKMMYSEAYIEKYKGLLPIMAKTGKPKNSERFIRLAKACLTCHAYDELDKIQCPVLVLGAMQDKVVSGEASLEIAEKLNCQIYMYEDLGHSAYEEAKDFNSRILEFLNS